MFRFFHFFLILLISTVVSYSQGTILVQVIHNSPDTTVGNLKVMVGNKLITTSSGIGFRQATPFFSVKPGTEKVFIDGNHISFSVNFGPNDPVVVIILQGVVSTEGYDNPYSNNISHRFKMVFNIKTTGIAGMISSYIMHGTTDAPSLTIKEHNKDVYWAENLDFNDNLITEANPIENEARFHNMDILSAIDNSHVASFDADLTSYVDKAMFMFTSGFLNPSKNKNGAKFGVFAALFDGTVIEFPLSVPPKPAKVILETPLNNNLNTPMNDYVTWKNQNDAVSYNLQISESNTFNSNIVDEKDISDNRFLYSDLKESTKYYWKVQAVNAGGVGEWSDVWSFTTKKNVVKPVKATLLSPVNNAVNQLISGNLKWNSVQDAEKYDVEISNDEDFANVVLDSADMKTIQYTYYALEFNTKYFWHVKAKNEAGDNGWSETWSFTTKKKIVKPAKPTLLSPANDAVNQPVPGLLSWNMVEDAETYDVQIGIELEFIDKILDSTDIINPECIYYDLAYNSKYFWRIKAKNEAGIGDWSDTWTFTTTNPDDVDDFALSDEICVYPNPAEEYIYVTGELSTAVNQLIIYRLFDMTGTEVYKSEGISGQPIIIPTSGLSNGAYFLKAEQKDFEDEKHTFTKTVIIQR